MRTTNRRLRVSRMRLKSARDHHERRAGERNASPEDPHLRFRLDREMAQRKLAELEIARARQQWERTFDAIPDLIAIIDNDDRIVLANQALLDRTKGYVDDIVGMKCFKIFCGPSGPVASCPRLLMRSDGKAHSAEMHLASLDGTYLVTTAPIRDETGSIGGCIHIARDISDCKKIEDEREKSRKLLQTIIDGVKDSITMIGTDYRVTMMNREAREMFLNGNPLPDPPLCYRMFHNRSTACAGVEYPCPLEEVARNGRHMMVTHCHAFNKSDSYFEILASPITDENGVVTGIIESGRDITEKRMLEQEKRRIEERLVCEQRELLLGTLAGGIAHDFNNALTTVLGNAELLGMRLPHGSGDAIRHIEQIMLSGEHMAHLVRQLLAYAKGGAHLPRAISIPPLIREALALTHKGKALDIDLSLDLSEDLSHTLADPAQISQALMNIFTNAFEAMDHYGGRLTVRARNIVKEPWECYPLKRRHNGGEYVEIRVTDTGPGMPPDVMEKIFHPFFSTKFLGRGLGLPAAMGIVQRYDGCISVESAPGVGSTLVLFLPAIRVSPAGTEAPPATPPRDISEGRILIVDDDIGVLDVLKSLLDHLGFGVRAAGSGAEALDIFHRESSSIDLAVLDIQMPDMDGKRLFRELRAIREDLKVLIASGYDEKTALVEMGECKPDDFIQKPFNSMALEEKIRGIVQRSRRRNEFDA